MREDSRTMPDMKRAGNAHKIGLYRHLRTFENLSENVRMIYYDMYSQDLLCANKNIIVSSPSLSGDRVVEFTKLIKEKMESGVEVTIVSWMPDKIRFGSSNYRMQLLEEMRQSGFYLKSAEDNCEHFAIIDQEIVWYGNINLLGKQDVEDHIMRIQSKEIASELMEMTFGNSLYNYLNNF